MEMNTTELITRVRILTESISTITNHVAKLEAGQKSLEKQNDELRKMIIKLNSNVNMNTKNTKKVLDRTRKNVNDINNIKQRLASK